MFNLYLKWTENYGLIWCRFLFWKAGVVVLSVDGIKDMFITNGGLYKVQKSSLTYFGGQRFTGYGGLLNNVGGDVWRRKRHALDPAFHKKYLQSLIPKMNEMTRAMIEQLKQNTNANDFIDMDWYMKKSAILLIASIGYGIDLNNREDVSMEQILDSMNDMMDGFFGEAFDPLFLHNPMNRHLTRKTKEAGCLLRRLGHDALKHRRDQIKQNLETPVDLLAHSIRIQENSPWYSDEEVVDDFVTFIVAGFETTSNVMSFVLALLARNPGVSAWAAQEMTDLVEGKQFLDEDDLSEMSYLECVIKEAMRLYPVVSLVRRSTNVDSIIDKHLIPTDTQVMFLPFLQGRLEEIWSEPLSFKPERFLKTESLKKFTYIPFLVGPRKCIGSTFAMNEIKIVVGQILQHFELSAPSDEDIEPEFRITLGPKVGTRLRLRERATS
ncbi:cholesterol 24-hydroxylase-like isoform X2 [Bolinopsis microptera]